jgi:hypothetical protein
METRPGDTHKFEQNEARLRGRSPGARVKVLARPETMRRRTGARPVPWTLFWTPLGAVCVWVLGQALRNLM